MGLGRRRCWGRGGTAHVKGEEAERESEQSHADDYGCAGARQKEYLGRPRRRAGAVTAAVEVPARFAGRWSIPPRGRGIARVRAIHRTGEEARAATRAASSRDAPCEEVDEAAAPAGADALARLNPPG